MGGTKERSKLSGYESSEINSRGRAEQGLTVNVYGGVPLIGVKEISEH